MTKEMPDEIYLYQHFTKVSPLGCEFDIELYPAQYDYSSGVKYVRADKAVPEWQPIETAPRDGTCILVYIQSPISGDKWQDTVFFNDIEGMFMSGTRLVGHDFITHWMPLPEPPK